MQTEESVMATLVIIVGIVAYNVGAWRERQKMPEYRASIVSRETCDARIEEVSADLLGAVSGDSVIRQVIKWRILPNGDVPHDVVAFCSEVSSYADDGNQFEYLGR